MKSSLAEFALQVAGQPASDLQFHVFADQIRRWNQGERVLMSDYLKLLPELRHVSPQVLMEHERLLEEAYSETNTSKQAGSTSADTVATLKIKGGKSLERLLPEVPDVALQESKNVQSTMKPRGEISTDMERLPSIPGFHLEIKLGLGGMGVVYKARQALPNRTVALKVMRYGSKQDLQRFLGEAEAIAKIQHPHIVGVYQVEMLNDQPILVLEYLPGGNLREKMAGKPQAAIYAATMMQKVASAVQAAHDAGVIHRDLKPANILLDAHGEPKITDFGLAKQSESESGLTASGAIMGSPSYMAPEQAMGKIRDIGPWTDVYALGAILYEMLTGRAPFLGEDPHETIMQVINQEPVSIRQLSPGVPRNIETICHKCLNKDRSARYSSAKAFADDLGRFIEGSPIVARRAGPIERLWRWMRRHPLICLLILALAGIVCAAGWIVWQNQLSAAQTSGHAGLRTLFEKALASDFRRRESQREMFQALLQSAELLEGKGIYSPEDSARHYQQLGKMAIIQGDSTQARKAWEKAVRLIGKVQDKPLSLRLVESQVLLLLGKLDSDDGRWDQSRQQLSTSQSQLMEMLPALQANRNDVAAIQMLWAAQETNADVHHELANWEYRKRQFPESIKGFLQAIEIRKGYLAGLMPGNEANRELTQEEKNAQRTIRRGIARSYGYLGDVLRAQGNLDEAMKAYAESENGRQSLVDEQPSDDEACFQLARSFENRGNLQARLDHIDVAVDALRKAVKLLDGITQEQPGIADYQYDLARVSNRLAALLYDPANLSSTSTSEARRLLERSTMLAEGLRKRDKGSLNYRGELGYALAHRARLNKNQPEKEKQISEAKALLTQLRQERNSPEDAYALIMCDLLLEEADLLRTHAALVDEMKKGLANLPQVSRDPLFKQILISP